MTFAELMGTTILKNYCTQWLCRVNILGHRLLRVRGSPGAQAAGAEDAGWGRVAKGRAHDVAAGTYQEQKRPRNVTYHGAKETY